MVLVSLVEIDGNEVIAELVAVFIRENGAENEPSLSRKVGVKSV
jgi:hypothetical protein